MVEQSAMWVKGRCRASWAILPSRIAMPKIHSTAIVDRGAELADDVQIEPYAIVGRGVTIDAGTTVRPHCIIHGSTLIGAHCDIGPAAYVGLDPQHLVFLKRPLEERQ